MNYFAWLVALSALFAVLERAAPWRRAQGAVRPQLANDLFYLLLHGVLWALVFGGPIAAVASATRSAVFGADAASELGWVSDLPFATQFLAVLVIGDLLQYGVHVLLHRVPWLWQFHKLHHSIHDMDWAGNFRFHWVETVVYRSLLYVPMLALGAGAGPTFAAAVFSTAWGHLNHANLNVGLGPLGRVFNSPRMHLWHHDASDEGGTSKNYGIVFSLWDHLFGTVYWPRDRSPARIGYRGDEEMPRDVPRQLVFPLVRRRETA